MQCLQTQVQRLGPEIQTGTIRLQNVFLKILRSKRPNPRSGSFFYPNKIASVADNLGPAYVYQPQDVDWKHGRPFPASGQLSRCHSRPNQGNMSSNSPDT